MFYNINNADDFWSRIQTTALNFNVFPSLVLRFSPIPDHSAPPLSHYCCGFSLSCTRLDLRVARVKKSAFISIMKIVTLKITDSCCGRSSSVGNVAPFRSAVGIYLISGLTCYIKRKPHCYLISLPFEYRQILRPNKDGSMHSVVVN